MLAKLHAIVDAFDLEVDDLVEDIIQDSSDINNIQFIMSYITLQLLYCIMIQLILYL